jgi:carboxyl-terminal processing protease
MSRATKVVVVCVSLLVFSYVALGYVLGRTQEDATYRALTVYGEVLQHIQQDYVEDPNLALVTSGALHGLLESLDPQSSYLSPREFAEYKQKSQNGAKGEVGIELSKCFGYAMVVSVLPDGPAQKAGLRGGDILEAIAGFTTREMSLEQARLLLAGDPGTAVRVAVVRRARSDPQEVELVRASRPALHAAADKLEGDVAYLSVPTLDSGRANEIREKLVQFDHQGTHKLVLDLRDCAQGEVSEAIATTRLFLSSGTIATLSGQVVNKQEFAAEPAKVVWKHPMTVLISNSTSGAAEVLAAGLGGNHRAELVGERTFGSASQQKLIPLEDGSALFLTVANYYTPAGKAIPDEGVAPTVEVQAAGDDQGDTSDESPAVMPSPQPAPRPSPADDPVLRKAIEILNAEARKAA